MKLASSRYLLYLFALIFFIGPASRVSLSTASERSAGAIKRVRPLLEAELASKKLTFGSPVFIRIFKESKELEVWLKRGSSYHHFKTYSICTYGFGGLGPKVKAGDGKAPEGFYTVTPGMMNPASRFHLAFNLGYPNTYEKARGWTGSALMVHGDCVSIGCYAMTDPVIEEIYALVDGAFKGGQGSMPVHIFPFRMTADNLRKHAGSEWSGFWNNLKEGYDLFEKKGNPPRAAVRNKAYVFDSL